MLEGSVASNATSFGARAVTLWRFSRPHTVIGTTLSAMGLYAMVCSLQGFRIDTLWSLLLAILIGVVGNVYIVGINQVEDVAIETPGLPALYSRLIDREEGR